MKVRMLAGLAVLSLAAWFPLPAQQAAAPSAPAQQSQAPASAENAGKSPVNGCCPAMQKDNATSTPEVSQAMGCCHGKMGDASKAFCCQGKDAKQASCCARQGQSATLKSEMNCCQGMKEGQRAANGAKGCCGQMNAKNAKGCCSGMSTHCPARTQAK
ncbi:MAG TPA: hypothetical protein VL128_11705 [Candidatus Eisenbacteria bacterium]|nr:hypothetical protein [Candidatus Eisenbacteria bacterium]